MYYDNSSPISENITKDKKSPVTTVLDFFIAEKNI